MTKTTPTSTLREILKIDFNKFEGQLAQNSILKNRIQLASLLINNNTRDYDEQFLVTLTDSELDKLIRILVIYEKYHFQGSATAVPNLLRILFQREYKEFQSLFNWVIQNNQNEYIPMGTFKGQNIKTLEEYALNITL